MVASKNGHLHIVKELLDINADITLQTKVMQEMWLEHVLSILRLSQSSYNQEYNLARMSSSDGEKRMLIQLHGKL